MNLPGRLAAFLVVAAASAFAFCANAYGGSSDRDGPREVRQERADGRSERSGGEREPREARGRSDDRGERDRGDRDQGERRKDALREEGGDRGDAEKHAAAGASSRPGRHDEEDQRTRGRTLTEDPASVGHALVRAAHAIERDLEGRERRSGEMILVGSDRAVSAAQRSGFEVIDRARLSSTGDSMVRVRVPNGESVERAVEQLRSVAPDAIAAPNHVFRPSAGERTVGAVLPKMGFAPPRRNSGRLGMVDTGVDIAGLRLEKSVLGARSFTGAAFTPREHGSAVAAIAASSGIRLDVADVFAADADGRLYATAEATASAIDWLIARGAPVINISMQGPDNPILAKVVQAALARGVVIVAAAGNDGPAAPPTYPAAYTGVVGVTAVDGAGKVYRRANRGDYVDFAALGVRVAVSDTQETVSGTSYAAPAVAAAVARRLHKPSPAAAEEVLAQLRAEAVDLGPPGRDRTFGWGWLR